MGLDIEICDGCGETFLEGDSECCFGCDRSFCMKKCVKEYQPSEFELPHRFPRDYVHDLEYLESVKPIERELPGCKVCRKELPCIDLQNKYFDTRDYPWHANWKERVQNEMDRLRKET
ncbi:hypothetical protein DFS34DRAFT_590881 [Phlyctochytrium arcticum]|nr:hypothetical protein DFS34DRAFT_595912 [Phlyctochytrium arcticum]KAI9103347.1 hypothetical protein DFS34DRAFT_590881 [Phlyctochytrium arcticum]